MQTALELKNNFVLAIDSNNLNKSLEYFGIKFLHHLSLLAPAKEITKIFQVISIISIIAVNLLDLLLALMGTLFQFSSLINV
jgi:hypothetical protein